MQPKRKRKRNWRTHNKAIRGGSVRVANKINQMVEAEADAWLCRVEKQDDEQGMVFYDATGPYRVRD